MKLPCAKCGALGHWYSDKTCPKYAQPFKDGKGPRRKGHRGYVLNHDVHLISLTGKDIPYPALVDTACAKSVVGPSAVAAMLEFCKVHGWPHQIVEDEEPFRFGPGKRIWSKQALVVVVVWAKVVLIMRISIVEFDPVPFLISKFALKRIGANIDLDEDQLSFKRFQGSEPHFESFSKGW